MAILTVYDIMGIQNFIFSSKELKDNIGASKIVKNTLDIYLIDVIVENSVSTFETASRKSKEAGTIYGRIFTSTPGDIDTDPGKRSEQLLAKTARWSEDYYDKSISNWAC